MKNPYEVLGVSEDSTDEEIKKAYRELVKKYHPDQYGNNPLSELAAEKLKEVNLAYDTITKSRAAGKTGGGNTYTDSATQAEFSSIVSLIRAGRLDEAQMALESMQGNKRTAYWYYLMGEVAKRKGWYDQARQYFQTAINMEPNNAAYRQAYQSLNMNARAYRTQSDGRGYREADNFCNCCQTLICADCCCECMGGDLIACC